MNDFSQLLLAKTDDILEQWVEALRQDRKIESVNNLPHSAIENHLSYILKAMASVLSQLQDGDFEEIAKDSLHHGALRAEQGFNPEEIAREYRILRSVIFANLEEGMRESSPLEIVRAFRLIDTVIDEAIALCFKSYTEQRMGELQHLQSQLTLNNQELTRLVRASKENISHLAHELKSPLTVIIGYADLFLRQQKRQGESQDTFTNLEHIERVIRSGRHLLHLINDALEISRFEAGKMILQPAAIDVRAVIKEVVELMEPLAQEKELKLAIDVQRAPEQVITDSLRLQQVVTNLVSNAIRYTETGTIEVTCQMLENEQWAIAVSDTGVGISPEAQKCIFEPYFQVADLATRLPDSTGLGLAIVSRLIKLLQGKIELVSQVGVGSTFTVILPMAVNIE
jgi:signal transduction histidine kinase